MLSTITEISSQKGTSVIESVISHELCIMRCDIFSINRDPTVIFM